MADNMSCSCVDMVNNKDEITMTLRQWKDRIHIVGSRIALS